MLSFLVQVYFLTSLVRAQYYQPVALNLYDSSSSPTIDDLVEQKYVNSGQSIILICDLPNNMPDGKVCNYHSYFFLLSL